MEHSFLSNAIEGSYTEKDIAKVFAEALDQTIYNMMLKDFLKRTGVDVTVLIAKAKATMLEDFTQAAKEKGVTLSEETMSRYEAGIEMGALQLRENLGLDESA